ncbi:uncharacterized protein PHACADRAFT_249268 [Phanerochaete carnosa HHB-10118-sp]|uniref:ATPase AAA-type core domain-containing protein n=1 Tax=Phanerochaete carnosa (strain HHB-10118-sp) TaxID=650164 RepID=K5WI78_PHACS|nr:uncharacterized protein PHACADRAFT_249268 [Phanerochaete carnosa HHB-10118-sp]EKM59075.1 hypothetical protein PHACADRAFT_249268 [Phanerochaete carnosa HHB-10118-sp]
MAVPESEPPKKLFPIFEKRKTRSSTQQKEQDDVVVSVAGLRLAKETASEVSSPEVDADLARSRSSSVQIQEVQSGPLATGSRRDAPIVIESSPEIKIVKLAPRPAKPVYSIFNHPARTVTIASRTVAPLPIPTPNKENQPDSVLMPLPTARARFPLRDKGKSREVEMSRRQEPLPGLPPISKYICSPQPTDIMRSRQNIDIHDHINMIPLAHQCIPSVSRLLQVARDDIRPDTFPSNEQWAECWRPRQADQVIGNEQHALYLRDWLQALRLQGESLRPANAAPLRKNQNKHKRKNKNKKPDVVRHVKRRRRDGREDDFFAPDDFTDSEDELGGLDDRFSDWDDIGFCVEMDARLNGSACSAGTSRGSSAGAATPDDEPAAQSYKPTRFGRQISNTILLAGPSGSGKTAAVYACAEELGWEVFEVYPGIGERSGAELNKLIGDVGKNHTVKVHQSPKKTNTKAAFFQKQAVQTKRKSNPRRVCDSEDELDLLRDSQDSQEVENETVDVIESSSPQPALEPTEPTVNQSVILIEEADILYHTDTNFWPALVNIIRHCRRPVVLTCNGQCLFDVPSLSLRTSVPQMCH